MDSTIIVALISLVGVVATALITKNNFSQELDKKIAVIETKLDSYGEDIKRHNGYSQLFAESMPAVKEHLNSIDRRLDNLEKKAG